jgi:lipopolysaccharide export system ATP-binding protein
METLIAEGIGKTYKGRQVVRGVDLRISRGEVVGLLGPNGAGKTTSFYIIVGLVAPETGRVLVDETDITRLPMYLRARNFGISYLPQEPSVFRKLTVEENILAVLEAQPLGSRERRTKAERLISQLNLGHIRTTRGYALSGGERRRVEIARSLCIQPNFILLDEPFSGIDPIAVLELQKIVFDLKAGGIGVLITDHNVRETLSVTDRAYIIAEGGSFLPERPMSWATTRMCGGCIWARASRWDEAGSCGVTPVGWAGFPAENPESCCPNWNVWLEVPHFDQKSFSHTITLALSTNGRRVPLWHCCNPD